MAWSTPLTAVANAALTYTQWNASVRDNLLETAPAKATASGRIFAATGVNTIAERIPTQGYTGTTETTTTTASYVNLSGGATGPAVTVTTGSAALVLFGAGMSNSGVNEENYMSITISGATTSAANDNETLRHTSATANARLMATFAYVYPLTAGSNTFTAKYKVSGGTGSYFDRRVSVVPF